MQRLSRFDSIRPTLNTVKSNEMKVDHRKRKRVGIKYRQAICVFINLMIEDEAFHVDLHPDVIVIFVGTDMIIDCCDLFLNVIY